MEVREGALMMRKVMGFIIMAAVGSGQSIALMW
jgi:hypothetical protein